MRTPVKVLDPVVPEGLGVKVIGLGGVGSIVARYVAIFLARHPSRLVLVDGDSFEPANATRMLFSQCGNKADVVRKELLPHFADSKLSLIAIDSYVDDTNIKQLIAEGDVVILAVDNHTTRKLVNDHVATLTNCVLISGGNDGIEDNKEGLVHRGTFGNVQVYIRKDGKDASPSLVKYHPEIKEPTDVHPNDKSCSDLVVSVPQVLFTNMQVATSMLGTLLLYLSQSLHYSEVAFDVADAVMNPIPIPAPNLYDGHTNNTKDNRPVGVAQ